MSVASYDAGIIGSGPAGLTAAIYCSQAGFKTVVFEKENPGGCVVNLEQIENYPGFSEGIRGSELASNMVNQATNAGAEFIPAEVIEVKLDDMNKVIHTTSENYLARAVIIAGGARQKKLGVPGEAELSGRERGVIYCATCDGSYFAGKVVGVAGGGDSGLTEALYLAKIASKVIVIEAMPRLTGQKAIQDRALSNARIEIHCGQEIESIVGKNHVEALQLRDSANGGRTKLSVNGLLVHIGLDPNTEYLKGKLALNERGEILVNESMETRVQGVFAAGDVRNKSPRQIGSAVGDGVIAAVSATRFLHMQPT